MQNSIPVLGENISELLNIIWKIWATINKIYTWCVVDRAS